VALLPTAPNAFAGQSFSPMPMISSEHCRWPTGTLNREPSRGIWGRQPKTRLHLHRALF